jgi:hypothetical protein
MAKLGRPYENLVALVAKALHPGARIDVGEWVEGPDGAREIDVSVRGEIDNRQTFILIECKDWKSDVGIAEIDALDSKRQDLNADKTMIVSNHGFTDPALIKARRKGIMCMSALAAGNDIIRFVRHREFLAKRLSVERYSWKLYGIDLPLDLKPEELEYDGQKFVAWLRDRSVRLLRENEFATTIHHLSVFKEPASFMRTDTPILIRAVELNLECRRSWRVQTIKEDVSNGLYDHLQDTVIIPDKEFWTLEFDSQKWREVSLPSELEPQDLALGTPSELEPQDLASGTIQLNLVGFNPIFHSERGPAPLLDTLVEKEETVVEPEVQSHNHQ